MAKEKWVPKVGDVVKIYGSVPCEVSPQNSPSYKRGERGVVTETIFQDEITVRTQFGKTQVHPKQCRRLVPKPKKEPSLAVSSAEYLRVLERCKELERIIEAMKYFSEVLPKQGDKP